MANPDTSMMSRPVRVRFAPSPTGFVHIGNVFLAVIDAALAARHGGALVVRIEDTDQKRFVPEAEQLIYDALRWLGLEWQEGPDVGGAFGPYRQSERVPLYQAAAAELIAKGRAYRCWCSPERLEEMRREQQAHQQPPKYDRLCLGKTEEERQRLPGYTERSIVRQLMSSEGQSTFEDAIRGTISFENALLADPTLLRSDGFATYHLAAVVDDHAMQITHVIRGEEWINSTPAHLQLYDAFGWQVPVISHSPLLLNTDRSKISKRRHPWANMTWFREQGYLPEAMLNYLGNLAVLVPEAASRDPSVRRELFGLSEIAQHLDLAKIGPAGKILDLDRLGWLNGQYIRQMTISQLQERVLPFLEAADLPVAGWPALPRALALEQERLRRLGEAPEVLSFFFRDEAYDPQLLIPRGLDRERTLEALRASRGVIEAVAAGGEGWTAAALEQAFRQLAAQLGVKTGQLFGAGALRVAVTGRTSGPPLFETMEVLGLDTVRRRLDQALEGLSTTPA